MLRLFSTAVILGAGISSGALAQTFGEPNLDSKAISMVALLSTPKVHDGQLVRVVGVLRIQFEGTALFLSREHYQQGVESNALWLSPDLTSLKASAEELSRFNGCYVLVEGTFQALNDSQLGPRSGAVDAVQRIAVVDAARPSCGTGGP